MKNDIFDDRIAYFVVKSYLYKITAKDIQKPIIMKQVRVQCNLPIVYSSNSNGYQVVDYR